MTDHTPGPWAIDSELPPSLRNVIARVGDIPISGNMIGPYATDAEVDEANMANARLIAAAPELLKALELLEDIARSVAMGNGHNPAHLIVPCEGARAALAKVKP